MKPETEKALADIAALPGKWKELADAAAAEAAELALDQKLDELEFLLKRGKYLCLRSIG